MTIYDVMSVCCAESRQSLTAHVFNRLTEKEAIAIPLEMV